MYLTYAEYKNMGGTLDSAAFDIYGYEANLAVKNATFNRITTPSEAVKKCVFRLIGMLADEEDPSKNIASYSNDGLSQSYRIASATERKRKRREIIRLYLLNETDENDVPLLYCGVIT